MKYSITEIAAETLPIDRILMNCYYERLSKLIIYLVSRGNSSKNIDRQKHHWERKALGSAFLSII
ncbi:CLUMA_CG015558, isoform A [Clunio marinus]|uniref:CLUMA_CG015558, isoform A n=1 Tax=Clunio marinus TaxID=568069 RepID=A0A1J1ISE8_9DIPT|nr:CLUMA_CG015558, isoform A [Clunio marinus]